MVIAIDGPAGSGKSTIAKMIARRMGFTYINSGNLYRALTLRAVRAGIGLDRPDALVRCAEREPALAEPLRAEIGHFTEAFLRKIDIVSAGTVSRRIATLLASLIERHGVPIGAGAACLPYKLTLAQVGSIADARVETVARVFGEWKKAGWLAIDSDGIHVLELDRLHTQIGE